MISGSAVHRIRAFCFSAIAVAYYYAARLIATRSASGLASADWFDLVYRVLLLFLLFVGYGVMDYVLQRQKKPLREMGLNPRPGWQTEFGSGAAVGWAALILCILPLVLTGGLYAAFWNAPRQWFLLGLDVIVLILAALTQEVVFRGYPFQRLIESVGPAGAVFGMALVSAVLALGDPFMPRAGVWVAFLMGLLLGMAYTRTRALWFTWGFHFAWFAAMALVFGLPIEGVSRYSPVIQSTAVGPAWMTGADYGPEAAVITVLVLLVFFSVVSRVTRDYAHKYAVAEIVPAGIPVDIDAMARRQHEAAMGPSAGSSAADPRPQLVQIGGIQPAPVWKSSSEVAVEEGNAAGEVNEPGKQD